MTRSLQASRVNSLQAAPARGLFFGRNSGGDSGGGGDNKDDDKDKESGAVEQVH